MYFLSSEESRWLLRCLVPKSREAGVAEELRGWNWPSPPLEPPYDVKIPLYQVAGKYCPTGRDLFLKRVENIETKPGKAMVAGSSYHGAVTQMFTEAKRLIYIYGVAGAGNIEHHLREFRPRFQVPEHLADNLTQEDLCSIDEGISKIRDFQLPRLVARIGEVVSKQPFIESDALASISVPVVCEYKLDGTFLGLSGFLSCDAAFTGGPVIFDLKFGRKQDFHRLGATGYALVMESLFEFPVDTGCIVYVDMRGDVPSISRELFFISDELRQWFIDERDEKLQMLYEESDPGVAQQCPIYCSYMTYCRGLSEGAQTGNVVV